MDMIPGKIVETKKGDFFIRKVDICAIGRYNTIRSFCKGTSMVPVMLKKITGQRGIYNSDIHNYCNVLDPAGVNENGRQIWYKGWAAVDFEQDKNPTF